MFSSPNWFANSSFQLIIFGFETVAGCTLEKAALWTWRGRFSFVLSLSSSAVKRLLNCKVSVVEGTTKTVGQRTLKRRVVSGYLAVWSEAILLSV